MNKLLPKILILLLIDVALIWSFIGLNPKGSSEVNALIPIAFIVNIVIAGVFYFGEKEIMKLFLINSILASISMFAFGKSTDSYLNKNLDEWNFILGDTTYSISNWKEYDNTFSISYTIGKYSNLGFIQGEMIRKDEEVILRVDPFFQTTSSNEYLIQEGYLYGFRPDSIKLEKVKW